MIANGRTYHLITNHKSKRFPEIPEPPLSRPAETNPRCQSPKDQKTQNQYHNLQHHELGHDQTAVLIRAGKRLRNQDLAHKVVVDFIKSRVLAEMQNMLHMPRNITGGRIRMRCSQETRHFKVAEIANVMKMVFSTHLAIDSAKNTDPNLSAAVPEMQSTTVFSGRAKNFQSIDSYSQRRKGNPEFESLRGHLSHR